MPATDNSRREQRGTWQYIWRPLALLVAVTAMAVMARIFGWGELLGNLRELLDASGLWGPAVFVFIYVLATVAMLPGSVMSVIAGTIFGPLVGVILVSIGSTLGASLAFLIARYLARASIAHWLSGNDKFQSLDELTKRRGAVIVAIVRLIPLFPFDIVNYGFGLTNIPFRAYVFWSWLCMIPGTILYVVGAAAVTQALTSGRMPWHLILLVAALIVILTLLVRRMRRFLKEHQ